MNNQQKYRPRQGYQSNNMRMSTLMMMKKMTNSKSYKTRMMNNQCLQEIIKLKELIILKIKIDMECKEQILKNNHPSK